MSDKTEIEHIKEQEDVKTALKQTTGTKEAAEKPVALTQDKLWFGTYILFAAVFIALHYLVGLEFFSVPLDYVILFRRLLTGRPWWCLSGCRVAGSRRLRASWRSATRARSWIAMRCDRSCSRCRSIARESTRGCFRRCIT